jgi:ATP-dependent Zn protease
MLRDDSREITYDKFIEMVEKDQIKEVILQSGTLTIVPKKQVSFYKETEYYTTQMEDETALTKRLEGTGIVFSIKPPDAVGEFVSMIVSVLLPTLLLFVMLMFLMRRMSKGGGGVMGVGALRRRIVTHREHYSAKALCNNRYKASRHCECADLPIFRKIARKNEQSGFSSLCGKFNEHITPRHAVKGKI